MGLGVSDFGLGKALGNFVGLVCLCLGGIDSSLQDFILSSLTATMEPHNLYTAAVTAPCMLPQAREGWGWTAERSFPRSAPLATHGLIEWGSRHAMKNARRSVDSRESRSAVGISQETRCSRTQRRVGHLGAFAWRCICLGGTRQLYIARRFP